MFFPRRENPKGGGGLIFSGQHCFLVLLLVLHFKVASNVFSVPAPIMTPFLWTLQTICICLSTSRSTDYYKRGRDWNFLSKLFNGHCHLSQVWWNRQNIKFVGWRTLTTWKRWSGYKRTTHQHTEATWRTLGNEIHSSWSPSHTIAPPTFKPGE